MQGVYSLDDSAASERTFQDIINAIITVFDTDITLGGVCDTTSPAWGPMSGAIGVQAEDVSQRTFGGILCHYAKLKICAIELLPQPDM